MYTTSKSFVEPGKNPHLLTLELILLSWIWKQKTIWVHNDCQICILSPTSFKNSRPWPQGTSLWYSTKNKLQLVNVANICNSNWNQFQIDVKNVVHFFVFCVNCFKDGTCYTENILSCSNTLSYHLEWLQILMGPL